MTDVPVPPRRASPNLRAPHDDLGGKCVAPRSSRLSSPAWQNWRLSPAASAKGGGTTRTALLRGSVSSPNATGRAVSNVSWSEREREIEVQHIKSLAGERVNVFANGRKLVHPRVGNLGRIDVQRNTELGQLVPKVRSARLGAS